jgi:hypothetical protein
LKIFGRGFHAADAAAEPGKAAALQTISGKETASAVYDLRTAERFYIKAAACGKKAQQSVEAIDVRHCNTGKTLLRGPAADLRGRENTGTQ